MLDNYLKHLTEEEKSSPLRAMLMDFFGKNTNPSDDQVHKMAEENGVDPHKMEEEIYALLSSLINGIGRHRDVPDEKFDAKELQMGMEVENEHTDCPKMAKEIAKDHLAECPDYYTRLHKMELECKKK